MANIKISELNLLTEKSYNDIIPIVDTSADETKKITIEDLVDNNVSLLAVTDIVPSECAIEDKYYNTITNKIYTATDTDTWSETGEEPIEGIFYIVFEDQKTYAYDGTELVSVGGAGGGAYIGTTEPTDENVNFWINPDEVTNTQQQEELYSTSEIRIGTWIDGKPLYRKGFSGTTDNSTQTSLSVSNINKLINSGGYVVFDSNYSLPVNTAFGTSGGNDLRVIKAGTGITLQTSQDLTGKSYEIWCEYTKTTD